MSELDDATAGGRGQPSAQDTGSSDGDDALAVQFSELARELQEQQDPERALEEIVQAAIAVIPGVDEGSISVVTARRHVHAEAASGALPRLVDELQERTGQGPCLDAAYRHETVRVADLASETRWPQFTAGALAAGAAGMLSFQLYVEGENLGALNLFSRTAGAFDDESEHVGLMFASHAAIAYAAVRQQEGLTRAVATRQLIGQAQGILMERHKVTGEHLVPLGVVSPVAPRGGLHLWAALPDHFDDLEVAQRVAQKQIIASPGRPYFTTEPSGPSLRLSYAALHESDADPAVRALAQVLAAS